MIIESVLTLKNLLTIQPSDTVLFSVEINTISCKSMFVVYKSSINSNKMLSALVMCDRTSLGYFGYDERVELFNYIKENPIVKLCFQSFYSEQYPTEVRDSHIPFIGFVITDNDSELYLNDCDITTQHYPNHEATYINTMCGDKILVDVGLFFYTNKNTFDQFLKEVNTVVTNESNTFVITNKVKVTDNKFELLSDQELSIEVDNLPIWMDIAKQAYTLCRAYEHDQVRKGNTYIKPKKSWDDLSPESRQIVAMSVSKIYKDGVQQSNKAFIRESLGNKTDVMVLFEQACEQLISKNIETIITACGVNVPKPTQIVEQI